jgi:tetratricopeptide (TPR) repeat protein
MELTKKEAFIKQLVVYLKEDDYSKAYELAKTFTQKFPDQMIAHFLLGRAAFGILRFEEAKNEARMAFNMSRSYEDMLATALLASTAHLELREYAKGYGLLHEMEKMGSSTELQTALVVFSLAQRNASEVIMHLDKLYALNERLAMDLANRIVGNIGN